MVRDRTPGDLPATAGAAGVRITAAGVTTVHRDGTRGLDDVHLSIEPGRLTAVIGPSGAGKTSPPSPAWTEFLATVDAFISGDRTSQA